MSIDKKNEPEILSDSEMDEIIEADVVVVTDEEGNEYYYQEEDVFEVGEKRYAILVPVVNCECDSEECDCYDEEDDGAIIAKIVVNENGEEEYSDPTDEEFAEATAAYDKLLEEDE